MTVVGVRSYLRTLAVLTVICERCRNPAPHRLVRRTRRVVVLFVPLFHITRTWAMTCSFCEQRTVLSPARVGELLVGAAPRPVPQVPARPHRP